MTCNLLPRSPAEGVGTGASGLLFFLISLRMPESRGSSFPADWPVWWKDGWRRHLMPWIKREDPKQIGALDSSTLFLLLVTSIWFSAAYFSYETTIIAGHEVPSWWGWYDQSEYYKTTSDLAQGQLRPSVYWFGYPLLGAPFFDVVPRHPYFIPDLLLVLVLVGSFFGACRKVMSRLEGWLLIAVFIFFEPLLRTSCLVVPWNTLPAYAAIYLSIYLLIFSPARLSSFVISAVMMGGALFSRPNEIVALAPIYLMGLFRLKHSNQIKAGMLFVFMVSLVAAATVALNFHLYGQVFSPYMERERGKMAVANFGTKLYQLFCDGAFLCGEAGLPPGTRTTQIFERFPIFLLLVPGSIYLVRRCGISAYGLFLSIGGAICFYTAYLPFDNPPYFWNYHSFHYIWWIIPWLGLLTYLSFRQAPFASPRVTYTLALIFPVILYVIIGMKAVDLASSDDRTAPLRWTKSYQGQIYTVTLTSPLNTSAVMDLRLQFSKPPPYEGSDVANLALVDLNVNGQPPFKHLDYPMTEAGRNFDFSFLGRGLRLQKGDVITVAFSGVPEEPILTRASLRGVRFAPGAAVARFFAR